MNSMAFALGDENEISEPEIEYWDKLIFEGIKETWERLIMFDYIDYVFNLHYQADWVYDYLEDKYLGVSSRKVSSGWENLP